MDLIHNGKQNYQCKDCGRQFVENPQQKLISEQTKNLVDWLLLEKMPLADEEGMVLKNCRCR
jgi:transposase-like protein